jgi:hypothetical protein
MPKATAVPCVFISGRKERPTMTAPIQLKAVHADAARARMHAGNISE